MKKVLRMFALLLALTLVLGCFAGCAQAPAGDGNAPAADGGDAGPASVFAGHSDQTYYMITFYPTLSIWDPCWRGFQAAAADLGVNVELAGPNSLDIAENVAAVEQAAALGATGICVSPLEPVSFIDVINNTIEGGTPVLCFDSDSAESNRLMYIGTSNYAAGQAGAEELARQIGGKGQVVIMTMVGQLNHMDRTQGAIDYLAANYPEIEVVNTLAAGSTSAEAAATFAAAMQAYPDIKGVFSTVATGTLGVSQTKKELGYDDVVNIGFDTDPSVMALMEDGSCTGTIAQNYYVMGYTMLVQMYCYCNGLINPYEGWKENGIPATPSNIDTGITVVTVENMHLFMPETE